MRATRIQTFTFAKAIDGDMSHEGETCNVDPHAYGLSFVTRQGMAGEVTVEASRWVGRGGAEYIDWVYAGVWRSVDDEPYRVTLTAEFTELA